MTVQVRIVSTSKTDLKFVLTISVATRNNFVERENPMLKILTAAVLTLSLAACASGSGGSSQMYGEIKAGVETSHQR
jgi:putative lipoprotein